MTVRLQRLDSGSSRSVVRQAPFRPQRLTISEPSGRWLAPVMDKLQTFVQLDDGWDGYSGVAVSLENALFAVNLLSAICDEDATPPDVVPGANGDLQLEWHTKDGDLELHIRAPNDVHAWHWIAADDGDGESAVMRADYNQAAEWLRKVTEPEIVVRAAA